MIRLKNHLIYFFREFGQLLISLSAYLIKNHRKETKQPLIPPKISGRGCIVWHPLLDVTLVEFL